MKNAISIIMVVIMIFSTISVSALAAPKYESESNDSYSTADTLNPNGTINGIINKSQDVDIFKVTTSENGKLTFTFRHECANENEGTGWIVTLYCYANGKYNQLSEQTVWGSDNDMVVLPSIGAVSSGVYYIKVHSIWTNVWNYDYSIQSSFIKTDSYEKEINNTYVDATIMSTNKEYKGYINGSSDVDIYKLVTSKSGKVTPVIGHSQTRGSDNTSWIVTVYYYEDGKYNVLSETSVVNVSVGAKVELPSFTTEQSRVYYIKIDSIWQGESDHEYSIIAKAPSESGDSNDASTDSKLSFMDILNKIWNFFVWLFNSFISLFK